MKLETRHLKLLPITVTLLLALAAARAEDPPDFSGTWLLDVETSRSEEFTQILHEYGLNWFERAAANKVSVEQTITQTTNRLDIKINTVVRDGEEVMHLDREWREVEDASGRPVRMRSYWNTDNTALIADIEPQAEKQKDLRMTLTRTLSEDGQIMYLEHSVQRGTNDPIKATRVLKKVESE